MRRPAILLLAAVAALGCELLVSTKGFDLPADATDASNRDAVADGAAADAGADAAADAVADGAPADAALPSCPCYAPPGAAYCGSNAAKYAAQHACTIDALDAGQSALLACAAGAWSAGKACSSGCATNASGRDQCVCPCYSGSGDYCGYGVLDAGGRLDCYVAAAVGHPQDLMTCAGDKDGGVWAFKIACPNGCMFNATGSDTCK